MDAYSIKTKNPDLFFQVSWNLFYGISMYFSSGSPLAHHLAGDEVDYSLLFLDGGSMFRHWSFEGEVFIWVL